MGNSLLADSNIGPGGVATYNNVTLIFGTDQTLTYSLDGKDGQKETFGVALTAPAGATATSLIQSVSQLNSIVLTSSSATLASRLPPGSHNRTSPAGNSTHPPTETPEGTSISPGAAAGIAIGCLVAGGILATIVLWLWLGRARRFRRYANTESGTAALMFRGEKGPTPHVSSLGSGSPIPQGLDNILPQPLEDKAITAGMSGLGLAIKNHVQSFYQTGRVSPGLLDLEELQALGSDAPISTGTLSTLLSNSGTREVALRFCTAWVVVSRMQLSSEFEKTLLPREFAQCFQAMAIGNRTSHAQALLFARWRALSAELAQTTYVRNPFSQSDPRHLNVEKTIHALDGILLPYKDSRMDNAQRLQNLREILRRAANFAFTLFSQPSTWDFDWQEQHGVLSGSLCIFPALVQVTDELGEPIKPPRVFTEAIVRRLDG
ncbi:uncharacterized protein EI97DRAFT_369567 [Westerdykella ornata]|uniref:Uncharacterized protein n=1 Tax=Westerdykella ornata TaxID=318751 RepID=A0A6A6JUK2_WESOR|nr:uncharacterized protein EI97DRAFT_369567 [Westerdykella ornata]KAF2279925.1 hypothetical protein EI97DRAFT_369567 [Westerdykella ornata]